MLSSSHWTSHLCACSVHFVIVAVSTHYKGAAQRAKHVICAGSNSTSPASKKRRKNSSSPTAPSQEARAGLLAEALHLLQRSQAVGESGIEALNGEDGVQEIDNTIVGADATIKAWRFMQVMPPPFVAACCCHNIAAVACCCCCCCCCC